MPYPRVGRLAPARIRPVLIASLLLSVATGESAAETLQGVVTRYQKGPCPKGNCEWMRFEMTAEREGRTEVYMTKRVIEGTVFPGHTVVVEGDWNRRGDVFNADRITDLVTDATVGHESSRLRYPEDQRLTLSGYVDGLQELQPPMPGQVNKESKLRFVLSMLDRNVKISVERVGFNIASLLRNGDFVVVDGKWTDRNVLRADRITRSTKTGQ